MARNIHRLTAMQAKNTLKPLCDGGGLWVYPIKGERYWIYRYQLNGKQREMSLGNINDKGLKDARQEAAKARALKSDRIDPITQREKERRQAALENAKSIMFRDCADAYLKAHEASWNNAKHRQQWRNTLNTYACTIFGDLPVQGVDTGLIVRALEKDRLWYDKPETASRVRQRIEAVLDWATVRGYRKGENPARWKGHLDKLLPKSTRLKTVSHHAALPYAEMGELMSQLRHHEGTATQALEFTILTAARTGEVLGAQWVEINLKSRTWTVPPERMKAKREHRVPLSDQTVVFLESLPRVSKYIFPGMKHGKPLSNMSMLNTLKRMGRNDLTVHGFRSTFRDWCAETTNHPREVAESALAHTLTNKVEAAYQRGDLFIKRVKLMQAWADWCDRTESADVTHIHTYAQ